MRRSLFVLAILLASAAAAAADKPDATLLGSLQPPANAVGFPAEVIYNRGHLEFDQQFIVIRVERRLKIYSSEGFGYGEAMIRYLATEEIAGIKAKTWLPSGKDVKAKEIHDVTLAEDKASERSFWIKEKVIAFPDLAPGVVLDLSYDHRIKNPIFLPAWEFQGDLPIRESSFTATLPEGVVYTVDKVNPGRIEIEEQESRSIQSKTFEGKWTARQVPAIVEEPYSPSLEALTARLYFTLKSIGGPGGAFDI